MCRGIGMFEITMKERVCITYDDVCSNIILYAYCTVLKNKRKIEFRIVFLFDLLSKQLFKTVLSK